MRLERSRGSAPLVPTCGSTARRVAWAHAPADTTAPRAAGAEPIAIAAIIRPNHVARNMRCSKACMPRGEAFAAATTPCRNWVALRRRLLRRRAHRIEQREQEQPGQKPADVRLPGDRLVTPRDRGRSDAEQQVQAEPNTDKGEYTWIAQYHRQRRGGNEVAFRIVVAPAVERTARLKSKSRGRCHKARYRGGCTHHRKDGAPVGEKMGRRAG